MTKDKLLKIANRNLKKAKTALQNQINRPGITEIEKENLLNNAEYTVIVKALIENGINQNYQNLIEDLIIEKENLLKKYEAKGAHALQIKALKSEINRCKLVLEGRPYNRRNVDYKGGKL